MRCARASGAAAGCPCRYVEGCAVLASPAMPTGDGIASPALERHAHAASAAACYSAPMFPAAPSRSKVVEHAGLPHLTPDERRRHLNFVVVRPSAAVEIWRLQAYEAAVSVGVRQTACQMCCTYRLLQQRRVVPQTSASPFSPACPSTAQVGGGPTGVELAAELHDLVKEDIARLQPQLRVRGLSGAGM